MLDISWSCIVGSQHTVKMGAKSECELKVAMDTTRTVRTRDR